MRIAHALDLCNLCDRIKLSSIFCDLNNLCDEWLSRRWQPVRHQVLIEVEEEIAESFCTDELLANKLDNIPTSTLTA
jgi:hypothetical protein